MVPLARLPRTAPGRALLRLAADDRLRGARRIRRLALVAAIWRGLVPAVGAERLGPLPRRPMGLGRAVGLELGRRRALGLCAVPLRPVGAGRRPMGLDPR